MFVVSRIARPTVPRPPVRRAALAAAAAAAAAAALATAPAGASAATVPLRITSPAQGSWTNNATPSISGETGGLEGFNFCSMTVQVYAGSSTAGAPVGGPIPGSPPGECSWTAVPVTGLADGTYTVQASGTRSFFHEAEPGAELTEVPVPETSLPVTFTVDTVAPKPTIAAPGAGASVVGSSLALSGSAGVAPGDQPAVTVEVFAGSTAGGTPVQAIEAQSAAGSWSGTLAGLSPGAYTLQAQQTDDAGNVGTSAPVPITVLAPPPPPPPSASFSWFPEQPRVGETVTLVSSSTDASSPITAFAWGLTATEPFHPGRSTTTTTFATPGAHVVRLQVGDAAGRTATATQTILVHHAAAATLMEPFPLVRLAGRETSNGVRLTLVQVTAPVSARVTVRLRGTGVRATSQSRVAAASRQSAGSGSAVISFPRFARSLAAGAVLEIRVTKAGQIGKLTRFIPRRGKLPRRTDSCLSTGEKPIVCPAS
jgi:hypothetical protein